MKVVIEFGRIYDGDKTFESGEIIEVDPEMAMRLGSQVRAAETEAIPPAPEPVKKRPGKEE